MKLHEFYEVTCGTGRLLSISESEKPVCGHDFWKRYSGTPEWKAEIDRIDLIPKRREGWSDTVICVIRLKAATDKAVLDLLSEEADIALSTDAQLDRYAVEVQNGDGYYDTDGAYHAFRVDC